MCASGSRWHACGDRFPRAAPRRLLRSLYIGERGARARALGCHCSCFRSRFASQFGDDSRLCRHSAFVSAGTLRLVSADALLSLLSSLVSSLIWSLVSALLSAAVLLLSLPALSSRLCFASVSSLPRLRLSLVA